MKNLIDKKKNIMFNPKNLIISDEEVIYKEESFIGKKIKEYYSAVIMRDRELLGLHFPILKNMSRYDIVFGQNYIEFGLFLKENHLDDAGIEFIPSYKCSLSEDEENLIGFELNKELNKILNSNKINDKTLVVAKEELILLAFMFSDKYFNYKTLHFYFMLKLIGFIIKNYNIEIYNPNRAEFKHIMTDLNNLLIDLEKENKIIREGDSYFTYNKDNFNIDYKLENLFS